MKKLTVCMIIAVFLLLLLGSTASAFRTAGVVTPQQYYSGGHMTQSGLWSSSSGGYVFFSFGKKAQGPGIFGDNFLKIDFPQTSVQFSEWSTTPQKSPTITLTNLPGPNWSPSFSAP
jgi:hypothetical protein